MAGIDASSPGVQAPTNAPKARRMDAMTTEPWVTAAGSMLIPRCSWSPMGSTVTLSAAPSRGPNGYVAELGHQPEHVLVELEGGNHLRGRPRPCFNGDSMRSRQRLVGAGTIRTAACPAQRWGARRGDGVSDPGLVRGPRRGRGPRPARRQTAGAVGLPGGPCRRADEHGPAGGGTVGGWGR